MGVTKSLPAGPGKGKGSEGRPPSKSHRAAPQTPEGPPSGQGMGAQGESETLSNLKQQLEGLQGQVEKLKGMEGSDILRQVVKVFATSLEGRILELAPAPKEPSLHAQSQRLQWKVLKKTKQVQGLKEKTQP